MTRIVVFIFLIASCNYISAQFGKKTNRGTSKREIRKRQEEADKKSSYNKFNKLQVMGKKTNNLRNDFIWSYATANVVPEGGGDLSLLFPSRFSLSKGLEIGASVGAMPFAPNLYLKKRWANGDYILSSKHQIYSYTPLMYFFDNNNYNVLPTGSNIPNVIGIGNEFITSKSFLSEINCGSRKEPYLVLTAALGVDFGIRTNKAAPIVFDNKFLEPRGGIVMGNNAYLTIRFQADYIIIPGLCLTAALRGLVSDSDYSNALEHNASVKYMLSPKVSLSGGYWLSFNKGAGTPILPILDISYHFGDRELRDKGLFGKKGYNTLR